MVGASAIVRMTRPTAEQADSVASKRRIKCAADEADLR
jgi:hypothetical protein